MNAEFVCIRRVLFPVTEQHFDYVLALDGKVSRGVEERLKAATPAYEVMVAFCPCAIHPASGGCVQQFLTRSLKGGSRGRQPHSHRAGGSRDDGSGSDGDPDPGPPPAARRFLQGRRP
jgi:hypothetical protein